MAAGALRALDAAVLVAVFGAGDLVCADLVVAGLLAAPVPGAADFAEGFFAAVVLVIGDLAAGVLVAADFVAAGLIVAGLVADGLGVVALAGRLTAGLEAVDFVTVLAAAVFDADALVDLEVVAFVVAGLVAAGLATAVLVRAGAFEAADLRLGPVFPAVFCVGFFGVLPLLSSLIWEYSNHPVVNCLQPEHEIRAMGTPRVKKAH
ncbi:MAG: hypothetical protein ABJQ71_01360 [Roseibium sp.]